jgi:hypothetical protein
LAVSQLNFHPEQKYLQRINLDKSRKLESVKDFEHRSTLKARSPVVMIVYPVYDHQLGIPFSRQLTKEDKQDSTALRKRDFVLSVL